MGLQSKSLPPYSVGSLKQPPKLPFTVLASSKDNQKWQEAEKNPDKTKTHVHHHYHYDYKDVSAITEFEKIKEEKQTVSGIKDKREVDKKLKEAS